MKNFIIMGYLYRVPDEQGEKFLKAVARGEDDASRHLGDPIGRAHNVTDIDKEQARELLKELFD